MGDELNKILKNIVVCLFIINLVFLVYIGFNKVYMPDEVWFFDLTIDLYNDFSKNIKYIFLTENYLGYGPFFWIIYSLFADIYFGRIFSIFIYILIPFCLLYYSKMNEFEIEKTYATLIIYFSSPLAWFSNKLFGPEILGSFFGFLSLMAITKTKYKYLWYVLLGISISIKIYNIVFLIFILIYNYYPLEMGKIKEIFINLLIAILSFLLFSLYILVDFSGYISNLSLNHQFSLSKIIDLFFGNFVTWDIALSDGINTMSTSLILIMYLLYFYYQYETKLFISIFTILLFYIVLFSNSTYYGWYFLPLTILIPFSIFISRIPFKTFTYILFFITINFLVLSKNIFFQVNSKLLQIEQTLNQDEIMKIVESYNRIYSTYDKIYITELNIDKYAYDFYQFKNLFNYNPNTIIYITKRYMLNENISSYVENSKNGLNDSIIIFENELLFILRN